ncbi:MAG TPA: PaaX family transcriptional regulator C-terminal domain-containing protein [Acidimicrobiales bacterium]|nr:PaaX family transcriptional regulator C-terminal domain-containing protein [Acidimicrobiales bacterium]
MTSTRPHATRTRRRADGQPSARALLLSILGQHVAPAGGQAWTWTLVGALGAVGVEERAARQALARSEAGGWFTSTTEGRFTRLRLTEGACQLLASATARLTRSLEDGDRPAWDGQWLILHLRPPADGDRAGDARTARASLQSRLEFEGFGSLASGLWIATDRRAAAGTREAVAEAGLTDRTVLFEARLLDDVDLVGQAWDLDAAAAAHDSFLHRWADAPGDDGRAVAPPDAFATITRLGHEWQELLQFAPDLPDELLPDDWPGRTSRARFVTLYRRCVEPAATYYTALTERDLA